MKTITNLCFAVLFCMSTNGMSATLNVDSPSTNSPIQRVRIDITTPMGFTRHLLLGFTQDNAATDGFDYGYDALNIDDYDDDCNWMIGNDRYVIQGVGAFHESKTYPLGLFLSNAGEIEFSLDTLENFEQAISVYIYDATTNTATSISDESLVKTISEGDTTNRFYITFTDDTTTMNFPDGQLSVNELTQQKPDISYISSTKELVVKTSPFFEIQEMRLYSILGQKVKQWPDLQSDSSGTFRASLSSIAKGTYLVSVKTKGGKFNKRLIISE